LERQQGGADGGSSRLHRARYALDGGGETGAVGGAGKPGPADQHRLRVVARPQQQRHQARVRRAADQAGDYLRIAQRRGATAGDQAELVEADAGRAVECQDERQVHGVHSDPSVL